MLTVISRKIFVIIIAILILIPVIYIIKSGGDEGTALDSRIDVENNRIRVLEDIQLMGEGSRGDVVTYLWDFGDGTSSEEMNPQHNWTEAGWYNVTLIVVDKGEEMDIDFVTICVQWYDQAYQDSRGRIIDYRRNTRILIGGAFVVGPNIGDPTVEIAFDIAGVIGEYSLIVRIYWDNPSSGHEVIFLYSESQYALNEDIRLDMHIEAEDFPVDIQFHLAILSFFFELPDGSIQGGNMEASAIFPL